MLYPAAAAAAAAGRESGWAPETVGTRWSTEQVLSMQESCDRPSRRQSLRRLNYIG